MQAHELSEDRGNAALLQGNHGLAASHFLESLKQEPQGVSAAFKLGLCFTELGEPDAAIAVLNVASRAAPGIAEIWHNLGQAFWSKGDFQRAEIYFRLAMQKGGYSRTKMCLGQVLLARGAWEEGWRLAQHGILVDSDHAVGTDYPAWQGQKLEGKLHVWRTEGIGDEILYAGMIPQLLERTDRIVWQCSNKLYPLLKRSFPQVDFRTMVVPYGDEIVAQVPDCVLGGWFRRDERQFPKAPYLVANGRGVFDGETRPVIGISYRSANPKFGQKKSIPLDQWDAVLSCSGTFVDLQYGENQADERVKSIPVDAIDDLDALATAIMGCDLIITVSNTTAHLAAALGKPVWALVSTSGGQRWCWMRDGASTPWYPSVTIYREDGDWDLTMHRVARDLRAATVRMLAQEAA